jgi:GTP diphosphokinase / guanosine-3',5'-bis(diphosphate) 3'-diphosphatase
MVDTASSVAMGTTLAAEGRRTAAGVRELLATVASYLPAEQVRRVADAAEFGASAHEGQTRLSGEPYFTHPVAAASILADLHLDADTIIAAILHDVIEDTPTPKDQIVERFGADVAELVDGVTKLDQIKFKSRAEAQAESFRKMLLAMVRDLRVILVKLADRTHNMRTIGAMSPVRRRAIARETLEIYAPLADRLGLYNMKLELEDLGFKALYPRRYEILDRAIRQARGNQRELLKRISEQLMGALGRAEIKARVDTREKHLHSIYRKMRRKRTPFNEIVDVYGIRIIVDRPDTCYRALGVVHAAFKPMPGRFKDYIAIPRVNGYQSLHTTLFGPNAIPIEAQIRTEDMHRVAESGVAAHWKYKAGVAEDVIEQDRTREWLSNLVSLQEDGSSEEFLESVKVDLFPDKAYVFTPKGEILRLPAGATVVDFAYAVHTDIGNHCVAAKVDRRLTPLRTVLRSGQTVEIITAKGALPNPAWVNFVVTAKARSAIRHYLKSLRRTEAIALGTRLLSQALAEFRLSLEDVKPETQQAAMGELGMKDLDELYEKIGLGERLAPLVARRLLPAAAGAEDSGGAPAPLAIAGTEGLLVTYAKCCYPIPDDPIFAFLSAGRGIVIHRESCLNVEDYRKHPEKWLPVIWQASPERLFNSQIRVYVINRTGVLAAVAAAISSTETPIERVSIEEGETESAILTFELKIRDRHQLARIVRLLRRMPDVTRLVRTIAARNPDQPERLDNDDEQDSQAET